MGEKQAPPVIDRFVYAPHYIVLIANALTAGASRTYFRTIGFGINESRLLSVLGHSPGMTQAALGTALAMNKSIVSRGLAALGAAGCVAAAGPDRARRFTLTEAGRRHHDVIVSLSMARQERLLAGFDGRERALLIDMLARLLANIPSVNDPGPQPVDDTPAAGA